MIHDEKTTEIEIPKPNVTQFRRRATDKGLPATPAPTMKPSTGAVGVTVEDLPARELPAWLRDLDVTNPWLIRLVAVLVILGLSLLVV